MSVSDFISLLGGVALFLFGMSIMGDALKKVAGNQLELVLYNLTSTPIKGVLLGTGVTAVIQSSSATSVMVVGFVNSGMMTLKQAVWIIMGANIGTTVTAQLLRLGDIDADNIVMMFLQPSFLGPILAVVGIIFYMFIKGGVQPQLLPQIIGNIFPGSLHGQKVASHLQFLEPHQQPLFLLQYYSVPKIQ